MQPAALTPQAMTDPEMLGYARQAINIMRRDLTQQRKSPFLLACCIAGKGLYRMKQLEGVIDLKLGEDWLGEAGRKAAAFSGIREAVLELVAGRARGFVIGCPMKVFIESETMKAMPKRKRQELTARGMPSALERAGMVKEGLLIEVEALSAVVQTPERVCVCAQPIDARGEPTGQPRVMHFAQSDFNGQLKMYP